MASESSSVSLAWVWIIEALASCKQADASLLNDLITRAPEFSDNLGKSTREVIALRCLEGLFGLSNGTTNDVPSAPDLKIEFNSSESCEDVLQRIVREVPISNLRRAGPELLKWDVHPFIMHKRACLPKCALAQLKDTILEGTHPSATFLRERSGLTIRNECDDRHPVGDGDPSALSQRFDGNGTDHQIKIASRKLTALTSETGNKLLQEDPPHRIALPSKRDRSDSANENLAGQCHNLHLENDGDLHLNAKKSNQGYSSTFQSVRQDLVPLHRNEQLDDSSGRTVQETETEGSNLAKESQVSEDMQDEYVPPERIEQSSDVNNDDVQHNQLQSCNNNKFPQDTSADSPYQNISVDGTRGDIDHCVELQTSNVATQQRNSIDASNDNNENNFQQNTPISASPNGSNSKTILNEAEDNMEHYCEEEMLSDCDGCHDEKIDVATKKHSFLSSQSTCGQDSMSSADWMQQNLCMKCNKDSQLLVCSSSGCPLVVHENCLGSSASFDNKGNFYCPFCAYSLAISEYREAKRKSSLARKELAAFIGMENKHQREKRSKRLLHKKEQNGGANLLVKSYGNGNLREEEDRQADHGGENVNPDKEEEDRQADHNGDDKQQAEPSVPCVRNNLSCREEEATPISWALCVLSEEKQGAEMVEEHQSIRGLERQQNEVPAVGDCADDNSCFRDTETSFVSWRQRKVGIQQEDLQQQVTNPPQEPSCEPNIKAEDTAEDENEKSIVSNYFIRFRSQEKHYTYPAIHLSRRKKISWTAEEEEILKEGVRRFSHVGDRNIPWKKIWEFGGAVFEKGRTPGDLKDKWRNICKGTPKPK